MGFTAVTVENGSRKPGFQPLEKARGFTPVTNKSQDVEQTLTSRAALASSDNLTANTAIPDPQPDGFSRPVTLSSSRRTQSRRPEIAPDPEIEVQPGQTFATAIEPTFMQRVVDMFNARGRDTLSSNLSEMLGDQIPVIDPATGDMLTTEEKRRRRVIQERIEKDKFLPLPAESASDSIADFIGAAGREMTDPIALATMPIGGAAAGVTRLLKLAGVGGAYEGAAATAEQLSNEGEVNDLGDIAIRTSAGAVAVPALDKLFRMAASGVRSLRNKESVDPAEVKANLREAMDAGEKAGMTPDKVEQTILAMAENKKPQGGAGSEIIEDVADIGQPDFRLLDNEPNGSISDNAGQGLPEASGSAPEIPTQGRADTNSNGIPPDQADVLLPEASGEVERIEALRTFGKKIKHVNTDTLPTGIQKVNDAADVAHVTAAIRKDAQESFMTVVADSDGNVLRVSRLFRGDGGQVAVDPSLVVGSANSTPGAAKAWVVHNHPEGSSVLSNADTELTSQVADLFRGSGVEFEGSVVVAPGGKFSALLPDASEIVEQGIKPVPREGFTPVSERRLFGNDVQGEAIATPEQAGGALDKFGSKDEGILLLNSENRPVGFLAMDEATMRTLRTGEDGGSNELFKALDETGADAFVVRTDSQAAAGNLNAFAAQTGKRLVDVIDGNGVSMADGVGIPAQSTFYSTAGTATVPDRIPETGGPIGTVRPDEIIQGLGDALDVPIRQGHVPPQASGVFKLPSGVIRRKSFNDLETISHEVGHLFESRFPELTELSKKHAAELLPIATKPAKGTPKLGEGLAEYFRLLLSQPEQAGKAAPGFHEGFKDFLADNPKEAGILFKTADQIDAWFKMAPDERLASKIGGPDEKIGVKAKGLKDKFITEVLEAFHPIKVATRELTRGKALPISEDPYKLARLSRGSEGIVDHFLSQGTLKFNFDARAKGSAGKSFVEALKPVAKNIDDFEKYMVARRADELMKQGRENLFTKSEIDGTLSKYESPEFKQAFDDVQKFQEQVLEYASDGGMLSKEAFAAIREANQNYVPFHRVVEAGQKGKAGRKSSESLADQNNLVQALRGSSKNISPPLESILQNSAAIIAATNRNYAARKLAELAEKAAGGGKWMERLPAATKASSVATKQIIERLEKNGVKVDKEVVDLLGDMQTFYSQAVTADGGKNQVIIRMAGGERVAFELDPDLYKAVGAMGPAEADIVTKVLSWPARTLRNGIVLSPDFQLRNLSRDTLSAFIQSKSGFKIGVDTFKGMKSTLKKNEDYWRVVSFGGSYTSMWNGDNEKMTRQLVDLAIKRGADKDFRKTLINTSAKAVDFLKSIGEITEMGTRIGESKRVFKQGGRTGNAALDAAFAAREVSVDFAMHGANPSIRFLTRITPFLNAGMQGLYKGGRTFTEEGFKKSFIPTAVKLSAGLILPSVALHLYNRNQDWYKERPEWERNQYWLIKPPGVDEIFRIPKPFEFGLLGGTMPERLVDMAIDGQYKENSKAIGQAAWEVFGLRALPPVFTVPLELKSNYNTFTGRNIVPRGKEGLESYLQYGPYTSDTAKELGKKLNLSPTKIEHFVRGFTGYLGAYTFMATDQVLRAAGDYPERPDVPLTQLPGAKAFFSRNPNYSSQPIADFYNTMDEVRRRVNSSKELDKIEDSDAEVYGNEPETLKALDFRKDVDMTSRELSGYRKEIEEIRRSRSLSGAEKRTQIDDLIRKRTSAAKEFNEFFKKSK